MKRFLYLPASILLSLMFFHGAVLAQVRTLVDKQSGAAIPYATIKVLNSNKGAISSPKGEFNVDVSDDDTLFISSLGFADTLLLGKQLTATIQLSPKPRVLPEIAIRTRPVLEQIILGNGVPFLKQTIRCKYNGQHLPDSCYPWGPSNMKEEFAERIDLPGTKFTYQLKQVIIPLRDKYETGSFLLRIYDTDTLTGKPGELVLLKVVETENNVGSKRKLYIDLSDEKVFFYNTKSFYISLGWPPGNSIGAPNIILIPLNLDNTVQRSLHQPVYAWHPLGGIKVDRRKLNTVFVAVLDVLQ